MLGFEGCIVASNRCHRPGLHRRHGFTAGKDDGGRLGLHNRPQVLGREITECAALPLAVVALGEIVIDRRGRRASLAVEDELGGLLTTLKRARHHPDDGHGREPVSGQSRLVAACLVQADAGCPTGQHSGRIGCGAAVPHENNCRHPPSLTTPSTAV